MKAKADEGDPLEGFRLVGFLGAEYDLPLHIQPLNLIYERIQIGCGSNCLKSLLKLSVINRIIVVIWHEKCKKNFSDVWDKIISFVFNFKTEKVNDGL